MQSLFIDFVTGIGFCYSGWLLFQGLTLMTYDPTGRPKAREPFPWSAEHLFFRWFFSVCEIISRNWSVRDEARRLVCRGLWIGCGALALLHGTRYWLGHYR